MGEGVSAAAEAPLLLPLGVSVAQGMVEEVGVKAPAKLALVLALKLALVLALRP